MTRTLTDARSAADSSYAAVLARSVGKVRVNLDRHTEMLDALAAPGRAATWRRLVARLGDLAGYGLQTVGHNAVQFFVADGRYRLQLFALEDCGNGELHLFLPDVLGEAAARRIVVETPVAGTYAAGSDPATLVMIEPLDAANTPAPALHVKFLIGLSRRAIRLTLSAEGAPGQIAVAAALCELAAGLNVPATSKPWIRGQPMPRAESRPN